MAVERSCCHDGVELPLVVRDCIDYVEEYGMNIEGLYKVPGVKSKVQHLKKLYNNREPVNISEFEPTVATSLLILFLRFVYQRILSPFLTICFKIKRKSAHCGDVENCQSPYWRTAKRYRVSSRPLRPRTSRSGKRNWPSYHSNYRNATRFSWHGLRYIWTMLRREYV